jgi:flagellar biosynthesis/type III secretory pathway M-ring protein FliF/YscJ
MDAWVWIVIAVAAVLLVGLVIFAGRRARDRQIESKRVEAQELRQEAETRARRAEERELVAQEQAEQARRERSSAEEAAERARRVDPDVD